MAQQTGVTSVRDQPVVAALPKLFVKTVKPLSQMSTVLRRIVLVSGDEVLQWNGKSLPGATKKEVYNIILESKPEPQVELVVSRPIG